METAEEQQRILETLRALVHTLQHGVAYQQSAPKLSHYRELPDPVVQSYDVLTNGAQLIHATATKFTLVGKIDYEKAQPLQAQLLQGCQLVATGCVAICTDGTGCAQSTRRHARQASRNIVQSVISLVEAVASSKASPNETIDAAASKTGVVWEACDYVSNKKLPMGNRNAIRRDLLTFKMECQETLQEFQQMIDEGPRKPSNTEEDLAENSPAQDDDGDDLWNAFLEGQNDQYSELEFSVVLPCLAILKCSRGCLNITLDTIEALGKDPSRFACISEVLEKILPVGDGITELGSCLYPPLDFEAVEQETKRQAAAIRKVLESIRHLGKPVIDGQEPVPVLLSPETIALAAKVSEALEKREREILQAIAFVPR